MADNTKQDQASIIVNAIAATHVKSDSAEDYCKKKKVVRGYDFDNGVDHHELLSSFMSCGFQSTLFARAVNEVNAMVRTVKNDVLSALHGQCILML